MSPPARNGPRVRLWARDFLLFGLPALGLLALLVLPLITGAGTLILRDVLQVHLLLKVPLVRALQAGYFPLVDPLRMGGQALAGNPNALPFYPDDLLFLVAPLLWAFNAHFWIHLLLAPLAACWMARAFGLSRPAAWAAGVCYGASGYMLSQLNLYNLVAGAALAPALVAAVLLAGEGRRRGAAAAGLVWALLLVAGDPSTALVAALLAASALVVVRGRRLRRGDLLRLVAALALGTLAALPQIVELLRILPGSFRGYAGYSAWGAMVGAWRPVHALEWLVPLAFGRIDRIGAGGFWGSRFFAGKLPLFLSLYPGLLALALMATSGRPRSRRAAWAWGAVGLGLFLALGANNPLGAWLFDLPGGSLFRYPVKLWPLVAVGAALLCGLGFERALGGALEGRSRPRLLALSIVLLVLGAALLAVWLVLVIAPASFEGWILRFGAAGWTPLLAAAERARWLATVVVSLALVAALSGALVVARRRPALGACLLLAVHAAGQVYLLRPLAVTDGVALFRHPPPALAAVPPGSTVAHAEYLDLFGKSPKAAGPDNRPQWLIRQDYLALYPFAGVLYGRRYELDRSPEGLETYLSRIATVAVAGARDDAIRLRALSRWGVSRVVAEDPLTPIPPEVGELAGRFPGPIEPISVYRLLRPAPELLFAESTLTVPDLRAAWAAFIAPGFDPEREVVLPTSPGAPVPPPSRLAGAVGPRGRTTLLARSPELFDVAVASPVPGVLVVQRADLPLWRATVDADPAPDPAGEPLPHGRAGAGGPPPGAAVGRPPAALRFGRRLGGRSRRPRLAGMASPPPRARRRPAPGSGRGRGSRRGRLRAGNAGASRSPRRSFRPAGGRGSGTRRRPRSRRAAAPGASPRAASSRARPRRPRGCRRRSRAAAPGRCPGPGARGRDEPGPAPSRDSSRRASGRRRVRRPRNG